MRNFKYTNITDNQSIDTEKNRFVNFGMITGLESTDSGDETSQSPRQHGKTLHYSKFEPRAFSVEFFINATSRDQLFELRDVISRVFNPTRTGVLQYRDGNIMREITCKPDSGVEMPIENSKHCFASCRVDLIAYDPYLYDPAVNTLELTFWTGGLTFPLVFPISFRQKGETKLNIVVEGQEPAPLSIVFKGPAINPKVTNHTTGEFIEVLKDLTSDQVLHITTGFKRQSVKIEENGIYTDAYNKINIESTFFELLPGANLLEYTSGETSPNDVAISFKNLYSGI